MAIPVSGADHWLTINGQPLFFQPTHENLQVGAREYERNILRITTQAPNDLEIWVDDELLETERYGFWYWKPKGFAGIYELTVVARGQPPQLAYIRVLPSRLSYDRYESMLEDIRAISEDLLFQLHSPAHERLAVMPKGENSSALREYKLVRDIYPTLSAALSNIRRSPHTRLAACDASVLLHQVQRFSSEVLPAGGPFQALPAGASQAIGRDSLPQVWSVQNYGITYDTYENRLLKHFLQRQLLPRVMGIREKAEFEIEQRKQRLKIKLAQGWEDDETERISELEDVVSDVNRLMRQCISWISEPFLLDVHVTGQRQQPTQVLQKNPHYNRFYQAYLRFQNELGVNLDAERYIAELSVRKLSDIYETWSVFVATNATLVYLGKKGFQISSSAGFFSVRDDLFQLEVDRTAAIELCKGKRRIIIRYEPVYPSAAQIPEGLVSRGSKQRTPDLGIEVWDENQCKGVILFDSKYRWETDDSGRAIYKDEDVDKMRAYRDVIGLKRRGDSRPRNIVMSAYILYPGDLLEHDPEYPEIGALPLLPAMEAEKQKASSKALMEILKILA